LQQGPDVFPEVYDEDDGEESQHCLGEKQPFQPAEVIEKIHNGTHYQVYSIKKGQYVNPFG
jgi:hypothetical protein